MTHVATVMTEGSRFVSELEGMHLHPLWDRYQRITPIKPQAPDAPFLWRWREIEPMLHRSVAEVSINDIERRALIMAHPAFGAETTTTSTMLAAFTVLDPGERARPHRHTGAAIRFATRAEGAVTIVDGRRCEMKAGDLILTPPMVWHGHINESDHRIIWFDAANMPLIRALDAHFFEPGDPRNNQFWQVDQGDERLWSETGLRVAQRHADARLLCRPFGPGHDHAPKTRDVQRRVPGDRGRGPLEHRRGDLRVVTARCLHHPALDVGAPRGARR